MSTSWYFLKEPFTHVRLLEEETYDSVSLWNDVDYYGTLNVPRGQGCKVLWMFVDSDVDDYRCAAVVANGKVRINNATLPLTTTIVSVPNKISTIGELLNIDNKRSKPMTASQWIDVLKEVPPETEIVLPDLDEEGGGMREAHISPFSRKGKYMAVEKGNWVPRPA